MLIKYSGKYVKIYFNMKITYYGSLGCFDLDSQDIIVKIVYYAALQAPPHCHRHSCMHFIKKVTTGNIIVVYAYPFLVGDTGRVEQNYVRVLSSVVVAKFYRSSSRPVLYVMLHKLDILQQIVVILIMPEVHIRSCIHS